MSEIEKEDDDIVTVIRHLSCNPNEQISDFCVSPACSGNFGAVTWDLTN